MKTIGTIVAMAFVLLPWCLTPAFSQQNAPAAGKEIVIIKRSIDPDGTEVTETIVKKGQAAENFDLEQYLKENRDENVELDVRVLNGDEEDNEVVVKRQRNRNMEWTRQIDEQVEKALAGVSGSDHRAFLGVEEDSDEDPEQPGIRVEVIRGSAADKAGLRSNDVILRLNEQSVDEWDDLSSIVGDAEPGDALRIEYSRNGKTATTTATLTTRSGVKTSAEDKRHGFLGITQRNGDAKNDRGVAIGVVKNSSAEKAGLQDGDVLLRLNDTNIDDWEDITDFMAYTKPEQNVQVTYLRNGRENTATATLGAPKAATWDFKFEPEDFNIDVQVREKEACLGVYSSVFGAGDTQGAKISSFTKKSAAQDAGMNTGDVITAVNGVRVQGPDELWDQIAKYQPGDKVSVDFLRENQTRQIEAALNACQDNGSRVKLLDLNKNETGNSQREFFLWNWNEKDQNRMREQRVITIHRGAEGDAPQVLTPETKPAADRSLKLEGFRAYPNPSQGQITVEFHSEPLPTIVSLLDMSGRQLFREELNAFSGDYFQQFDLSEYAKGTILIHVLQGDKVFTEQIIVN